jgi:DnaK suppressor protein
VVVVIIIRDVKAEETIGMDKRSRAAYKKKLLAKRENLAAAYNRDNTYGRESDSGGTQDLADKAATAYTKEFLYSLSNSERVILQEVERALLRVDNGDFGVCQGCEEKIHKKRLDAVPWARFCLKCQEAFDEGRLQEVEK